MEQDANAEESAPVEPAANTSDSGTPNHAPAVNRTSVDNPDEDLAIHQAVLDAKDKAPLTAKKKKPGSRIPRQLLTIELILAWADDHHARTGAYPCQNTGAVSAAPGRTWVAIDASLRCGRNGLAGGTSLARLLAECRGKINMKGRPPLSNELILKWADKYKTGNGCWPTAYSGPVAGQRHETWAKVDCALREGTRGLPGGYSLAKLLHDERSLPHRYIDRQLNEQLILEWADEYFALNRKWPGIKSGAVLGHNGETWSAIDNALIDGLRGLPGGSSLAKLLAEHRGAYNRKGRSKLTEEIILSWVDEYYQVNGRYPNLTTGAIEGQSHESWSGVNSALGYGIRGLERKTTLKRLIAEGRMGREGD